MSGSRFAGGSPGDCVRFQSHHILRVCVTWSPEDESKVRHVTSLQRSARPITVHRSSSSHPPVKHNATDRVIRNPSVILSANGHRPPLVHVLQYTSGTPRTTGGPSDSNPDPKPPPKRFGPCGGGPWGGGPRNPNIHTPKRSPCGADPFEHTHMGFWKKNYPLGVRSQQPDWGGGGGLGAKVRGENVFPGLHAYLNSP